MFDPGSSLQPSVMFEYMVAAFRSEAPFRCSALGLSRSLMNIRLCCKGLPRSNTKQINYGHKVL